MYLSLPTHRLKNLPEDCIPGKHQGSKSTPFGLHTCETVAGADIGSGYYLLVAKICTRLKKIIRYQEGKPRRNQEKFYAQRQKEHSVQQNVKVRICMSSGTISRNVW